MLLHVKPSYSYLGSKSSRLFQNHKEKQTDVSHCRFAKKWTAHNSSAFLHSLHQGLGRHFCEPCSVCRGCPGCRDEPRPCLIHLGPGIVPRPSSKGSITLFPMETLQEGKRLPVNRQSRKIQEFQSKGVISKAHTGLNPGNSIFKSCFEGWQLRHLLKVSEGDRTQMALQNLIHMQLTLLWNTFDFVFF